MNLEKEKVILENLISSPDVFSRCISILKPEYFDPNHRSVVLFLIDYYEKYKAIPPTDIIKAESKVELSYREVTKDLFAYTCDNIEQFCRNSAMQQAILDSSKELLKAESNMGSIFEAIKHALAVSLPKDLGTEFFDDPERRLKSYIDKTAPYSTGLNALDRHLDDGLRRSTLTLFSANSGVGKSIMLANIGANYAKQGLNVLYLSLELPESMIYLRLSSITTEMPIRQWKENIPELAHKIHGMKEDGAGSYLIKRMPVGATANEIRGYLKLYELDYGYTPDVLIVDYLDIMRPNEGTRNLTISDQDKLKAEQLNEILLEIDAIGLSASQQNREAIDNNAPNQSVIAGGLTKVNAVDNYVSIFMNGEMRLAGEMMIFFLKTRSSDGVGKSEQLYFDSITLKIKDNKDSRTTIIPSRPKGSKDKPKRQSKADEILRSMKKDEAGNADESKTKDGDPNPPRKLPIDTNTRKESTEACNSDDLLNFMETL